MLKVNFVEENGRFHLLDIEFESLEQVKKYVARWFPTEDMILCQVATRKEAKDKCLN